MYVLYAIEILTEHLLCFDRLKKLKQQTKITKPASVDGGNECYSLWLQLVSIKIESKGKG